MAIVNKVYDAQQIWESPADVYFGVTAPASAVPPDSTNLLVLDTLGQPQTTSTTVTGFTNPTVSVADITGFANNQPITIVGASGTHIYTILNLTSGGFDIHDSAGAVIDSGDVVYSGFHVGLTDGPASFHINQKFSEIRADQFEAPIDYAFISTDFEVDVNMKEVDFQRMSAWMSCPPWTTASKLPTSDVMTIGGVNSDAQSFFTLLLVGINRVDTTKFSYLLGYRAHLKAAFQMTFHRATTNVFKVKFTLVADTDRAVGDEFAMLAKHTQPVV